MTSQDVSRVFSPTSSAVVVVVEMRMALPSSAAMPKVMVSKFFVSEAEGNFFRVLRSVVGERGHVLAQVSLNRLLYLPRAGGDGRSRGVWQNRIAQKSIDFVVCDPRTLRPLVAIELMDATHGRPDRQTRDDHVTRLCAAAELPLLCLNAERTYNTRGLAEALAPYLPPRRTGQQG